MRAHNRGTQTSGGKRNVSCCPASSCLETLLQRSAVRPAATTAAAAIGDRQAPLGLNLSAPYPPSEQPEGCVHSSGPALLDGLLREINQRKKLFSQRAVPWLKWQIPHPLLDSTDVTQLMYCIGRQFRLSNSPSSFYCVSFRLHEVSPERLALFRGLGFNAIEIVVPPQQSAAADALAWCTSLAEDFHFPHLSIEWQTSSAELCAELLETVRAGVRHSGRPPETVAFRPEDAESSASSRLLRTLYWQLTGFGYGVLGNDVFIRPDTPLAQARCYGLLSRNCQDYNCQRVLDVLGLGPGNTSSFGALRITNAADLESYLRDSFDHYRLEPLSAGMREVIDQLLCYHQLNLIYFREQHRLDLELLFSQLETPAWPHQLTRRDRLYDLKNHTLTLTSSGVLQLSSLCQALTRLPRPSTLS